MRTTIVGAGVLGREIAEQLARRREHEIVLIERDAAKCEALSSAIDALVVHGDGTVPATLEKAAIRDADALVAATDSDSMNIVIAMLGRHFDVETIVVRLDEPGLQAACQELGAMEVIAPRAAAASRIVALLCGQQRADLAVLERGGLELVELPAASVAGGKLADLQLPDGVLIAAVSRAGRLQLPARTAEIESDDALLVLVEDDTALGKLRRVLGLKA